MNRRRKLKPIVVNRLYAIGLLLIGMIPVITDNDYTAIVLFGFFAVMLWFQKRDLSKF